MAKEVFAGLYALYCILLSLGAAFFMAAVFTIVFGYKKRINFYKAFEKSNDLQILLLQERLLTGEIKPSEYKALRRKGIKEWYGNGVNR